MEVSTKRGQAHGGAQWDATSTGSRRKRCGTAAIYGHLGLIGVFVACLLGKRVLAAHCAFATMLIIALTAYSAVVDHVPWFERPNGCSDSGGHGDSGDGRGPGLEPIGSCANCVS
jgi:hypothetical protein